MNAIGYVNFINDTLDKERMSKKELAEKIGSASNTTCSWLRGDHEIPLSMAFRMLHKLGYDMKIVRKDKDCKNCGHSINQLNYNFCPNCGFHLKGNK